MTILFVVNRPNDWPHAVPGVTVVSARAYLEDPGYAQATAKVFNLCRTDRYQGRGYYVSLIAEARGHAPCPDVKTLEASISGRVETLSPEVLCTRWALPDDGEPRIEIDSCFGRDPARRFDAVAEQLLARLDAPLVRASFERRADGWHLVRVRLLGAADLPPERRSWAADVAAQHLAPAKPRAAPPPEPKLAILHDPDEPDPPSNAEALERFADAGRALGMRVERIGRGDLERLSSFDGLFIRDTTHVSHYTYEFARRAAAEGLVVIDDPDSILKCTNKVYLNELLARHRVPVPKTMVVHRDNVDEVIPTVGLPCIVKQPDAAFSLGVAKVESEAMLSTVLARFFAASELLIAQEWLPTEYDWRVGVLDQRPLFVCKYLMAPGHWQVVKREPGRKLEGRTIAMAVGEAPACVVRTAVRAANLIGDGLYGVDLKQVGDQCYVIEINDNPNVDAGNEDDVMKDALYREVMGVFLRRIRERATATASA